MANTNEPVIVLPQGLENLQLPTPELVTFYKDLDNRCFWIEEEIGSLTLEVIRLIIGWNREDEGLPIEDRKPIKFFFFSPGGDLDVNYALIDTIKLSKTPIYGINVGRCCSAAAYIYLSCHKRFMLPHAYFLFHQGSSNISGTFGEVCSAISDYQNQVEELAELIKERTKFSTEYIENNIVREWYVRQKEAQENGVCDSVINSIEEML